MKAHHLIPEPVRAVLHGIMLRIRRLANLRVLDSSRLYKYHEIGHLRRLFERYSVDCVFDVGANRGQYGAMLRRDVGYRGRIISFEPDPVAAATLRKVSRGDDRWEIRMVALADRSGVLRFNIMRDSQFNSLSSPRYDETLECVDANRVVSCVDVPAETLAEAVSRAAAGGPLSAPYLKMDTQGFDMSIVSACPDIARTFVGVQTEVAFKRLYDTAVPAREVLAWYESHGFELSAIVPNNHGHFPVLIESDFIFVQRNILTTIGRPGSDQ